ncbi:Rv3235 family protein [Dietzia sp. B32]|uniref:Rv3235 family protein n=1 Tax=Dietzia sp. B32 TaxID=2915130 RepID=UPI0021AD7714|nr:Rv3235 family protein [Dietzia sp. B32]UVE94835.1 Rv3235 family protein [Dietzia sp. B32]
MRPPPAAGTVPDTGDAAGRVRPLPSVEPVPGASGDAGTADQGTGPAARPPRPVPDPEGGVPVPARRAAHALVVMALEVVDRRRAPQHTKGAFPPHLVEMLRTLARDGVPGRHLGPARIHRLHIHAADPGRTDSHEGPGPAAVDYEVCATYARGPRLFAVAARIQVTPTGARCAALRLA